MLMKEDNLLEAKRFLDSEFSFQLCMAKYNRKYLITRMHCELAVSLEVDYIDFINFIFLFISFQVHQEIFEQIYIFFFFFFFQ
jgi:hypothetical protein